MALKDLEEYLKKGSKKIKKEAEEARKVATTVLLTVGSLNVNTALAQNTADNVKDKEEDKKELTVNWGEKNREMVQDEDGTCYVFTNDETCISFPQDKKSERRQIRKDVRETQKKLKEDKKDYKEDQEDAFASADADKEDKGNLGGGAIVLGEYSQNAKNITMFDFSEDMSSPLKMKVIEGEFFKNQKATPEKWDSRKAKLERFNESDLNHSVSHIYSGTKIHENQHKTTDELNTYAPGISAKDAVVLNKYDEISANVAELNYCISVYKKAIKQGLSQEEAMAAFDEYGKFDFYKEKLQKGMDPDSKEAKKLMVEGTINMWEKEFETVYKKQLGGVAEQYCTTQDISLQDAALMLCDNPKEVRKRINKMFDNINNNEASRKMGIEPPKNLSDFLPDNFGLSQESQNAVYAGIEKATGISVKEQQHLGENSEKRYSKRIKNVIQRLRGCSDTKKNTTSPTVEKIQQNNLTPQAILKNKTNMND